MLQIDLEKVAPLIDVFKHERVPGHIANSFHNKDWGLVGFGAHSEKKYKNNVYRCHIALHLSQCCCQCGIGNFALYPNSTHLIQPMEMKEQSTRLLSNEVRTQELGTMTKEQIHIQ